MRLNQVDLNLFLVFDAIYTQRNLTRAASVLCITQPAASNALSRLRKTFNDPLFTRTQQGMQPTPFAKNIIDSVRQALQLLTMSVQEGEAFDPQKCQRQINCSMNDLCESLVLPQIIDNLHRSAAKITLNSYYISRNQVAKELSAGTLDFAIDVPGLVQDKNLSHLPLSTEEFVCVVSKDHPHILGQLTLEQYLASDHLLVSSRRTGQDLVDAALRSHGHQRQIRVRVKHYLVATKIVEKTNLILTLPKRLAKQLNVNCFDLPFEIAPLEWHLFWHKSADQDQVNIWLRQLFIRSIATS